MPALFRGKVFCSVCGRKHKYKKRSKKPVYVCSTYDNYGVNSCYRNQVDEEIILWLIKGHFHVQDTEINSEFIDENVYTITSNPSENVLTIRYKDGLKSIFSDSIIIR